MRHSLRSVLGAPLLAVCGLLTACGGGARSATTPASNELLIIGYDREPDTMNRYATHILEDIESCVVEGLVTNDEQMRIIPLLAASIPTLENGGCACAETVGWMWSGRCARAFAGMMARRTPLRM